MRTVWVVRPRRLDAACRRGVKWQHRPRHEPSHGFLPRIRCVVLGGPPPGNESGQRKRNAMKNAFCTMPRPADALPLCRWRTSAETLDLIEALERIEASLFRLEEHVRLLPPGHGPLNGERRQVVQ